jgi:Zn-dependent M28 family amino/carboxypeptidase
VIFNEGQPANPPTQPEDRTVTLQGTLGAPGITIPVVGTSYAIGAELVERTRAGAVTVHVFTQTISETRTTLNVIGDYKGGGDKTQTIVVGSHLDSVTEGPGINDNGSGTATDLETAIQVAKLGLKPRRALRFAFWGAEENNLLGSQYYVDHLGDAVGDIYANLNFDMLGSPNYVRFVYDGDGSDTPTAGPAGSGQIEAVFNNYFAGQGLATDPTAFDGRSDYGPFIGVGIPAGGCSAARRERRQPNRRRPTAEPPGSRTTRATTRPATPSRTSAPRLSLSSATASPTRRGRSPSRSPGCSRTRA